MTVTDSCLPSRHNPTQSKCRRGARPIREAARKGALDHAIDDSRFSGYEVESLRGRHIFLRIEISYWGPPYRSIEGGHSNRVVNKVTRRRTGASYRPHRPPAGEPFSPIAP